jgi:hypothetical protein
MTHIAGHACCEILLLPGSLTDYFGAENLVRFLEATVDGLDLADGGSLVLSHVLSQRKSAGPTMHRLIFCSAECRAEAMTDPA